MDQSPAIQVFDLSGKLMATRLIQPASLRGHINTGGWPGGIYVVNLRVGNSVVYSEKVVKL